MFKKVVVLSPQVTAVVVDKHNAFINYVHRDAVILHSDDNVEDLLDILIAKPGLKSHQEFINLKRRDPLFEDTQVIELDEVA